MICEELSIVAVDDENHFGLSLVDSSLKVKEKMYLANLSYLMHTDFLCLNSTNLTLSSYFSLPIHHTSSRLLPSQFQLLKCRYQKIVFGYLGRHKCL